MTRPETGEGGHIYLSPKNVYKRVLTSFFLIDRDKRLTQVFALPIFNFRSLQAHVGTWEVGK